MIFIVYQWNDTTKTNLSKVIDKILHDVFAFDERVQFASNSAILASDDVGLEERLDDVGGKIL